MKKFIIALLAVSSFQVNPIGAHYLWAFITLQSTKGTNTLCQCFINNIQKNLLSHRNSIK